MSSCARAARWQSVLPLGTSLSPVSRSRGEHVWGDVSGARAFVGFYQRRSDLSGTPMGRGSASGRSAGINSPRLRPPPRLISVRVAAEQLSRGAVGRADLIFPWEPPLSRLPEREREPGLQVPWAWPELPRALPAPSRWKERLLSRRVGCRWHQRFPPHPRNATSVT